MEFLGYAKAIGEAGSIVVAIAMIWLFWQAMKNRGSEQKIISDLTQQFLTSLNNHLVHMEAAHKSLENALNGLSAMSEKQTEAINKMNITIQGCKNNKT